MIIKLPSQIILDEEVYRNYKEILYLEGVVPIRELSVNGMTAFEISQVTQGALGLLTTVPTASIEYSQFTT